MENNTGGGFFSGVVVTLIVVSLVWGIGSKGKYEGQTAEEWFNEYEEMEVEYQNLYDCVEPYATNGGNISADNLYYECF